QRSNEELEQFAFITSHDLQEPLRMISSYMDQLKRKYADKLDDKAIQYIHFATDGAKRMKEIILDLLAYSRANRPNEQK
ncbi:histidine kinase dimerization/phospho-acceptor domain-containing protein, partial [Acinetobacter baumannii]